VPATAAIDNETLDHLLSVVNGGMSIGAFWRFGRVPCALVPFFDTTPSAMKKYNRKNKGGAIDRSESLDKFLAKNGLLAETEDAAIMEIIADQIKVAMDKKGLSKSAMAAWMKTSRRQLDRLLDPENGSVTLATLRRAASAVGRNLRVELE
jgi:antitoxin HicB